MFNKNLAYEASAGSGKTFMLVVRYLSLLFLGASPTKILALTFTNKAAFEMQERVVETLEELETRGELDEIVKVTGFTCEYLLSKRQEILDEFLNAHTKIMTIDKFFATILRKFSLYASLMPDFTTMNSQHELKLLSQFLIEVRKAKKTDILITLSLQSKKRLGDIFTLLDEFYVKHQELLHVEFKQEDFLHYEAIALDALDGLKNIVDNCSGASATLVNSLHVENFDELKEKSWVGKDSLNYWVFKKCFIPEMDIYLREIQNAVKNHARAKEQNFFYALSELTGIYEKAKQALYSDDSELSFNDVTVLVYYILRERIDSEFLYFRLDSQIEHILLDEFQDTSILQYEILKPLIEEILAGDGASEDGSFFFVGDVKQSIYRFRGGVSALFGAVKEECQTEVEPLLTNYRSQKEVIEFVNRTFSGKIRNYQDQHTRDEANGGYVEIVESEEIVDEILLHVKKFIELGADINEVAILCATNGDGEVIKQRLQDENIEVVTETTTKLINQTSVKAVLEYLKYLYFEQDIYRHNFFALINKELKEVDVQDVKNLKLLPLVKKIIAEYNLFSDDFHLIRFLDVVASYEDIESLLFEYERIDTNGAASDLNGVRVLTIHKSKGLEYEHIIVMDRLKKPPPARNAIIFDYDGIKLQNLYLRTKGRDAIDEEYALALQKEKDLAQEDSLNALYVAFTRPRDNLLVIMKPKDSSFGMLELEVGSFGELVVEKVASEPQDIKIQEFDYEDINYGTQSDILKLEDESDEDLKAINFGLALHYMLEMMASFEEKSLKNASYMMINKFGYILDSKECNEIIQRVTNFIADEKFNSLLSDDYYKEQAIRYKKNLRYIDLLVKTDTNWNIIDYKTSLYAHNKHISQVASYVKAVSEITGDDVVGYICYILEHEIKIVKV